MIRFTAAALALAFAPAASGAAPAAVPAAVPVIVQPIPHRTPQLPQRRSNQPRHHGERHLRHRRGPGAYQPYVTVPPAYVESVLYGTPPTPVPARPKPTTPPGYDVFYTIKN